MSVDLEVQIRNLFEEIQSSQEPVTIDEAERRVVTVSLSPGSVSSRRTWSGLSVALAAAVVVLVVGSLSFWVRQTASEAPLLSEPSPSLTVAVSGPITGGWSRVPYDEAVFGGEGWMSSVTAGGPGLVAVGSSGSWSDKAADAAVWTSVDGTTWSRVSHDESVFGGDHIQGMSSVVAGGPGLVAVGFDGEGRDAAIWSSIDGHTWSRVPHEDGVFEGAWIEGVTAGGPGLVAVGGTTRDAGDNDAVVWTSVDGIAWSRVPHDESIFGGVEDQYMSAVTVGGPGLVAVGTDGGTGVWDHNTGIHAAVWTSVDGIKWSRVPNHGALLGTGGNPAPMLGVTTGGPGLVAVGGEIGARTPVWTSLDGFTWTRVPDDETVRGVMFEVIAGESGLKAIGCECNTGGSWESSWNPVVWTSLDGFTWTRVPDDDATLDSGEQLSSLIIHGPHLIAVGSGEADSRTAPYVPAVFVTTQED